MTTTEGSLALHRRSEFWAVMAECRAMRDRPAAARRCYARAAEWELRAFATIPETRPRTRGTIGRSAFWLLVKSGQRRRAFEWRAKLDADPTIPESARREMEP